MKKKGKSKEKSKSKGPKKFAFLDKAREASAKEKPTPKTKALAKRSRTELPTKAVADERTESLRERVSKFKGEWWEIGMTVLSCLNDHVPEALKLSATAWLEEVFGGEWQRYRRAMKSCKALTPGISLDTLKQISEGNAYTLASLPEKLQTDPAWVKKAASMKNADFEEAVMAKRKELGDTFEKEIGIWTVFKLGKIEESFKDIVTRTFETAAHHLAAQGLEVDLNTVPGRKAALEEVFGSYLATGSPAIDVEPEEKEAGA
jgi:hypothetical protein